MYLLHEIEKHHSVISVNHEEYSVGNNRYLKTEIILDGRNITVDELERIVLELDSSEIEYSLSVVWDFRKL